MTGSVFTGLISRNYGTALAVAAIPNRIYRFGDGLSATIIPIRLGTFRLDLKRRERDRDKVVAHGAGS